MCYLIFVDKSSLVFQLILGFEKPGGHDPYESLGSSLHGSTTLHSWSGWRSGKFRQLFPKEEFFLFSLSFNFCCLLDINRSIRKFSIA